MALFNRCILNTFPTYYKFQQVLSTSIVKFKLQNYASITSNILQHKGNNKQNDEETVDLKKSSMFDKEIARRRNQACRSIIVQVYSANSYNDLQSYCSQFGQVLGMHHFQLNKQDNYILIEFQNVATINEIMLHGSFESNNALVSAKSPILWFRKGNIVTFYNRKRNEKKMPQFTENNYIFPTEKAIAELLYNAKSVSGQIINLYEVLKLDDLEVRLRFHTACYLEQYFSGLFQNTKVLPFGSSVNGFGKKRCDLDLVILPDDTEKLNIINRLVFHTKPIKHREKHEVKAILSTIASNMQYFLPGVLNVRKILEAKVPIIKFNYKYTQLECDLSITNMTAVYMSELLFFYGEIDWRVRPLVIAIRQWAKYQDLTCDSPGCWITNFSLTLLVLFYLQQKKILPSLNMLRVLATSNDARCIENGIDCTFLRDISRLPNEYTFKKNNDSLEELFRDFFKYYSEFDFHTKGICIREGTPIEKPTQTALHITNPLETTLNVSKNVNSYELKRIIMKAHDSIEILKTADKSTNNCWGLMPLLNIETNVNVINFEKTKRKETIQGLKDNSHEATDKCEVTTRPEVQEKETKEICIFE